MILYLKLWNFDSLWKKRWYYGKKLWYYSKLLFTTVNYSLVWYFLLGTKSCSAVIPMIPRILQHTVFLKIITYIFVYSQLYHWHYHQVKSQNWCSTFILMILKVNTLDQCRCTKRTKGLIAAMNFLFILYFMLPALIWLLVIFIYIHLSLLSVLSLYTIHV